MHHTYIQYSSELLPDDINKPLQNSKIRFCLPKRIKIQYLFFLLVCSSEAIQCTLDLLNKKEQSHANTRPGSSPDKLLSTIAANIRFHKSVVSVIWGYFYFMCVCGCISLRGCEHGCVGARKNTHTHPSCVRIGWLRVTI